MRKPRTPRRTFIGTARREQIITSAIDVLTECGYAQTSLARIAERAGISKSVIPYYFAGKDQLLQAVVELVYVDGARYIKPRVEAERAAPAMLAAYVRCSLEFTRDHAKQIAALTEIFVNVRRRDGAPRFAVGPGGIEATLGPLQALLRRGQVSGEFADFDTRSAAWAIRTLIDGVNRQRLVDPRFDFARAIEELTRFVERATRKGRR